MRPDPSVDPLDLRIISLETAVKCDLNVVALVEETFFQARNTVVLVNGNAWDEPTWTLVLDWADWKVKEGVALEINSHKGRHSKTSTVKTGQETH